MQRQEIIVKVQNIAIKDKTEEVINKLRKINQLFEAQRRLTKEKERLNQFKMVDLVKMRGGSRPEDSFKEKTGQCRKITQRLKLCSKLHKTG